MSALRGVCFIQAWAVPLLCNVLVCSMDVQDRNEDPAEFGPEAMKSLNVRTGKSKQELCHCCKNMGSRVDAGMM